MSGGTKQQFKQFSITCAEDACLVLGMLISGMTVNLEKYKEYASEAESLLESTQEEYVPAKEYDDVNDKLLYRQREILKFTADHQSSSFSYIHPADNLGFLRYDDQLVVLPLVSEDRELAVWYALLEPFDRTPFDVFGNAAAFFLCEGSEDGKHQLSVAA